MWNVTQMALLNAILDELIPPSDDGRVIGAGALGIADFLPSAEAYVPDPIGSIHTVINAVSVDFSDLPRTDKIACLKRIEAEHPDAFATLLRLTYMGYYSRPDTRTYFGVGSNPVHPGGYNVAHENEAMIAELTAPVRARGKVYRNAK